MLGLTGRVLAFYAAFAYPLALLCAIPYFDHLLSLDPDAEGRRLRRAQMLVLLAPLHVLFPITALGIVRDMGRHAKKPDVHAARRRRLRTVGSLGVLVSALALVGISRAAS